jgi:dephospho-CoA kinase
MKRVALTGGIATGKSYVAARLHEAGVPVVDADVLAREAVAPGSAGLAAVAARFGPAVIGADGTLDRPALADIVFRDRQARRDLEAIVHPEVRRRTESFFSALPPETPFAVADIPLLYETGRDRDFDLVIVAVCSEAMQIERVMARDGATREQAEARIRAQMPIRDKARRAHFVVRTDGTFAETDQEVADVLAELRRGHEPATDSD